MIRPARLIRIDDKLWNKAKAVAADLASETGLSATASDVVRKALVEFIDRYNAVKRASKQPAGKHGG
jgi:hypothetical protein